MAVLDGGVSRRKAEETEFVKFYINLNRQIMIMMTIIIVMTKMKKFI